MPKILSKFAGSVTCGPRIALVVIAAAVLSVVRPPSAHAGFCSSTDCTLTLNESNFLSGNNFGTVSLHLNTTTHVVTVNIDLGSAYRIITTGFPGAAGFHDTLGGGLTIGNFSSTLYSGYISAPSNCTSNDCHWDGFGYANNAAATLGPPRPESLEQLSFNVGKGSSIIDVDQLLALFNPAGGQGLAMFVVDACLWDFAKSDCKGTGLFAVPKPGSLMLLGTSLMALAIWRWRRILI